jgi:hypothetical protein
MASEATLNKNAVAALNKLPGVFVKKRWGGPGQKGQVDITGIVVVRGFGVRIELEGKLPGERPTKIQQHWLDKWWQYHALTGVYHSVDQAVAIVQEYINQHK